MYYPPDRKDMPADMLKTVYRLSSAMNDFFFREYFSEENVRNFQRTIGILEASLNQQGWSAVRNEMTGIWEPCPLGYSITPITPLGGGRTFYCPIAITKSAIQEEDDIFYFAGARVGRLGNSKIVFEKWYQAYRFLFLYANRYANGFANCSLFPWETTKEDMFIVEQD